MINKSLVTTFALILLTGTISFAAPLALEDETARISYSLGYQIGGDFKQQGVGITPEAVVQGIQDALTSSDPKIEPQVMNQLLVDLKKKVVTAQRQEYFQSSRQFMADNLKKEGVKALDGGAQYKVIQSGSGPSPTLEDTVMIRFTTSRSDGSSVAVAGNPNEPKAYPVKDMLPGLQSALVKMKVGDIWAVFVPPGGRTEMTEKGGVLIYQIELLGIQKPAAAKTK